MNLAGESLRAAGEFFKLPAEGWLVVHDEIELPFGELRMQKGGGLGGHNGLRSVKQHLGTDQFYRLRLGIGRPTRGDVASFVLGNFSHEEKIELPRVLALAGTLLEATLREGFAIQSGTRRKQSS
jgi:PTH1 family peptidyl-tRNA hydrolase